MKDLVIKAILAWASKYVTKEKVEEWLTYAKNVVVPYLRSKADELVAWLAVEATKSETPIDDKVVLVVKWVVELVLPATPVKVEG